ncbi:RICIN domain-containing protein [Streptomyces sp. 1222.5]|uniref:RICIN domain-containing protein n=1 Tax=Streptomyces sp. 1222.5 TaxID=1881026 RepID=UPI003D7629C2
MSNVRGRLVAATGIAAALLAVLPAATASATSQPLPKAQTPGSAAAGTSAQDGAAHHLYNRNSGLCLNVSGYSQNPSSRTEIWYCNGNPAENWQLRDDGTIYNPNSGLCLNVAGYATSPSSRTEIWGCNGNPAEKWQLRDDGTIYNPNSGLCLNVAGYGTSPSDQTELWYCQNQPSEKWATFDLP